MPLLGFEPTTSVFERAKTVHALDRAARSATGSIGQIHFRETDCSNEKLGDLAQVRDPQRPLIRVLVKQW
jgi:hypothetical protein